VESTVEVTYREDGTLHCITASAACEDDDLDWGQRISSCVAVSRSLLLHAHNDLDMLNESAPADASALTSSPESPAA
jgi:hypothetical protein